MPYSSATLSSPALHGFSLSSSSPIHTPVPTSHQVTWASPPAPDSWISLHYTSSLSLFRRFWDCYLMCSMSWLSVAFSSFLLFLRDLYLPAWPVCLNFGLFIGPCLLLSGGFFVPAAGLTSAFDLYLACFTILKAFLPHFVEEITEVLLPCWHKPQQHLFFCLFVVCF